MTKPLSSKEEARKARATACGKAIIVGEHAVVYGAAAVAIPLVDLRMQVDLTPIADGSETPTIRLKLGGEAVSAQVRGLITDALELLRAEPFSLNVDGWSQLPIGAGLGSSATLCVAILRALAGSLGRDLALEEIARFANILEARFHGNPSGLDSAVVAHEIPLLFRRNEASKGLAVRTPERGKTWPFALIDSGVRASTLAMVRQATPYFTGSGGERRIGRFDELAEAVVHGFATGDVAEVARAMEESAIYLEEASVVPPLLKDIMLSARAKGALAAKPTGAGGGGMVLVLLDPTSFHVQLERLKASFGAGQVYYTSVGEGSPDLVHRLDLRSGASRGVFASP